MTYLVKFFIGLFFLFVISVSSTYASDATVSATSRTTYEAFWPLTAGRTMDDSLYFLKVWKETLRGMLVFGNPQKAEYAVYLGTKRALEADKLLGLGKTDLANKTLTKALEQLDFAQKNVDETKKSHRSLGPSVTTMQIRLTSLTNLLPDMQTDLTNQVLDKVKNLQMSL